MRTQEEEKAAKALDGPARLDTKGEQQ